MGSEVVHSYAAEGTYAVTLKATDDDQAINETSQNISVSINQPPIPSFAYSCTGLGCDFDGSGSTDPDGAIVEYTWSFGDGGTGNGKTANHTYGSSGPYTVTLTVTDDSGATKSTSEVITVGVPAAPSNLTVTVGSTGKKPKKWFVDLNWQDNSSNEQSFSIERAPRSTGRNAACDQFEGIGSQASNVNSYRDESVDSSSSYCYQVRSLNSAGSSESSNVAIAKTGR